MQSEPYGSTPRRTSPSTAGWLAIIVMAFLAGVGIIGALATVGVFTSLLRDLPSVSTLDDFPLQEESIIYDRTGKIELARFGDSKRDIVDYKDIPPILLDATTAVEDKTFWENAGFDPVAIISAALDSLRGNSRGASTITQQLVRARLLDPDARPGPEPDGRAQAQGDHPVDPADRASPGRGRQAEDHHRLPQPELLREPGVRREGRGQGVLRDPAGKADTRPGGDHRGPPEVAVELRPRAQRVERARSIDRG